MLDGLAAAYEVVAVDDGSTDDTARLLGEFRHGFVKRRAEITRGTTRPSAAWMGCVPRRSAATSTRPGINAEAFYSKEISLPMFPDLTDADVDRVIEIPTALVA